MRSLMKKTLVSLVSLALPVALVALTPGTAQAGRGGSFAEINTAIQSGSVDGIVGSLERAEYLLCGNCNDIVVPLLDHDSARVREVAAWWLRKRPARVQLVQQMTQRLTDSNVTRARNAAEALGNFKDPAQVPLLGRVVTDASKPAEVRAAAARSLGVAGYPEGAAALQAAIGDSDAGVRRDAVRSLRYIRGFKDGSVVVPALTDSDVLVRRAAVQLAGVLRDPQALNALTSVVQNDQDARVRRQAAWALGQIGSRTAFEALSKVSTADADAFVRAQAKSAMRFLH
jgi:HEAT repeat protein